MYENVPLNLALVLEFQRTKVECGKGLFCCHLINLCFGSHLFGAVAEQTTAVSSIGVSKGEVDWIWFVKTIILLAH